MQLQTSQRNPETQFIYEEPETQIRLIINLDNDIFVFHANIEIFIYYAGFKVNFINLFASCFVLLLFWWIFKEAYHLRLA